MKTACQAVIALLMAAAMFRGLHQDFYGIKARKPWGFQGAVATVVLSAVFVAIYWQAGTFSNLIGAP